MGSDPIGGTQGRHSAEALQRREEGRVVAKLWIDTSGKVVSCTVTQSSGSAALDQKTCSIALEKVSFEPATDRRGRPVVAAYILPVRWVIPSGPRELAASDLDNHLELTVSFEAGGEVIACHATKTAGVPAQIDPCAEFPVGKQSKVQWTRDGKLVGGTMVRRISERIALDP